MDAQPELLETIEDGIATLTFNRPERMNALSTPIMEGLLHGLPRLADDPAVKVVVLTGAGRAFCAGGDVKSMAEGGGEPRSAAEATAHLRSRMEVSRILYELPKPTIAMINGPAAGAGLALALACDRRIAGVLGKAGDRLRQGRIFRRLRRQLFFDEADWDRQSARTLFHRPPG